MNNIPRLVITIFILTTKYCYALPVMTPKEPSGCTADYKCNVEYDLQPRATMEATEAVEQDWPIYRLMGVPNDRDWASGIAFERDHNGGTLGMLTYKYQTPDTVTLASLIAGRVTVGVAMARSHLFLVNGLDVNNRNCRFNVYTNHYTSASTRVRRHTIPVSCYRPVAVSCNINPVSGASEINHGNLIRRGAGQSARVTKSYRVECSRAATISVGLINKADIATNKAGLTSRLDFNGTNYGTTINYTSPTNVTVGSTMRWTANAAVGAYTGSGTVLITVH